MPTATPFALASHWIGELRISSFELLPPDFLPCDGQLLDVSAYPDLFEVIGYTYGGAGNQFRLPDLRGRVPVGVGAGGGMEYTLGQTGGVEVVSLSNSSMPAHTHRMRAAAAVSDSLSPADRTFGRTQAQPASQPQALIYRTPASAMVPLEATAIKAQDGGPHANMQPFLTLIYAIAFAGLGASGRNEAAS
jgi:microcystin-dependent protein